MGEDPRLGAAKLGMVLAVWAERQPDVAAVTSPHGDRTFAALNADANRLSRALRARGVTEGDGVALLCANRPEFVETFAATQRSGMRLTTVNWHLTADETAYIVDDCQATALVADARFADVAVGAAAGAPRASVRIAVGGDIPGFERYEDVVADQSPDDLEDPVLGSTMLYTSGTTGRPKGVYRDPAAAQSQTVLQLQQSSGYKAGRHRHLCTGPLYHAAPLAFSLTAPLSGGAGIVLMDGWDAEETLRLVEEHGITHTHMVPTMFHRLLALPDEVRRRYDVTSLRFVIHGAAPCPVPVKQALMEWWGPIVHEYYAATEGTGTIATAQEWLARPGTVGRAGTPDHVRILDEDGAEQDPGVVGLVYLRAPGVNRFEYFNAPQKTAEAYRDDYFTLGDRGYLDADGYLFLTDRSADLIITGGVNVYPAEVEAVLLTHPAVADVGVIGVPSDEMGEDVIAVVQPRAGLGFDGDLADELIAFCRDRLAHFKCPRRVEFDAHLPRRDNGKLYKHGLRERYRGQT